MLCASRNDERACTLGVHKELFGQVLEVSVVVTATATDSTSVLYPVDVILSSPTHPKAA